jgi:hypothetical protein
MTSATRPLVELCGGSAAVSLAVDGLKPPVYYRGGKRRSAKEILRHLPPVHPCLVNDAGPWSEFWEVAAGPFSAVLVRHLLEFHQSGTPRELFKRLAEAPVPKIPSERVAVWLVLQHYAYASRPVYRSGSEPDTWVTPGFCGASADRAAQRERALAAGNRDAVRWAKTSRTLLNVVDDLEELQGKIRFVTSALDLKDDVFQHTVPDRAVVYLDPPYRGRSCGYSHELDRADVLRISRELASMGKTVVVSEAEPLPLEGARHVKLSGPRGGGATSSRVSEEWLTILGEQ